MADVQQNVNTYLRVIDAATGPLRAIHGAASKVNGLFNSMSNTLGTMSVIAGAAMGALSLKHAVGETMDFLTNVKRISDLTHMTTQSTGGMLDAMESFGIEGHEATRALTMMSKVGARMEMSMGRVSGMGGGMRAQFKAMGIDINKGPEKAIFKMAELAEKNKLTQQQLMNLYRMQPETARKFIDMLSKGPVELKKSVDEFKRLGIATEENVSMVDRIRKLQFQIKNKWGDIQMLLAVRLLPAIEKMLTYVRDNLDVWAEKAQKFGKALGSYLRDHLETLMKISKVLLFNFALMRLTGKGLGDLVIGAGRKGFGAAGSVAETVMKRFGRKGVAANVSEGVFAKAATPMAGMLAASSAAGAAPAAAAPATALFAKIAAALPALAIAASVIALLAVVAAAVGAVFVMIKNNTYSIRDFFIDTWNRVSDRVSYIVDLLGETFGTGGPLEGVTKGIAAMAMQVGDVIDWVFKVVQVIVMMLRDVSAGDWGKFRKTDYWREADRKAEEAAARRAGEQALAEGARRRKEGALDKAKGGTNFNFPNARFDISQKFAEGFDPDRIAVAFTNDLATLGERRVQGISPFSVPVVR